MYNFPSDEITIRLLVEAGVIIGIRKSLFISIILQICYVLSDINKFFMTFSCMNVNHNYIWVIISVVTRKLNVCMWIIMSINNLDGNSKHIIEKTDKK